MTLTLTDAITEVIATGRRYGHEYEWLTWDFFASCVRGGDDEPAIPEYGIGLAGGLCLSVANWGAEVPLGGRSQWEDASIASDWAGPRARSGKHLLDGTHHAPYGGLHLPHWDSGALEDWYEQWGWPQGSPNRYKGQRFDEIRKTGGTHWDGWLDWSTALLKRPEVHEWSIRKWLREFWGPSWRASVDDEEKWDEWMDVVRRALINVRIRNSAPSWAEKWAHLPADEQARRYIEAKGDKRGDHARKRAERQVSFVRRAQVLVEAAKIEVIDG